MATRLLLPFTALGWLQGLDVLTTDYIIRVLGGFELNPIMAGVVGNPVSFVAVKCMFLLSIATLVLFAQNISGQLPEKHPLHLPPWTGLAVISVACAWYVIVVSHNVAAIIGY